MLRPNERSLKLKFLEISPKVETRSLQWLLGFFVFAILITLVSEHLPDFLRQFSFQLFLMISLIALWWGGWVPSLGSFNRVVTSCAAVLLGYFVILKLADLACYAAGYVGQAQTWRGHPNWILAIVVAPILEELFFRDALLKSLYQRLGRLELAVLFSSAFFMVAHLNLYPGAFLLGLVSALLLLTFKNIWTAILFHSISNLSLIFIPALFPHLSALMIERGLLPVFYR
jgi:membrane protease YdiL (CAAX protease family)